MSVQFISHKSEVLDALHNAVSVGLEIIGGVAESHAADICPVDTGTLRDSITHQPISPNEMAIGTSIEYAPFVELGTRKMSARPYLRPAAENHSGEYRAIMERVLGK